MLNQNKKKKRTGKREVKKECGNIIQDAGRKIVIIYNFRQ